MAPLALLDDLAVIFVVSAVAAVVLARMGVPSVVGFLATGVLVGPHGFGLVDAAERVEALAEMGVVMLLFTIGLEVTPRRLAHAWRQVLLGGGLQVGLTLLVTAGLVVALGGPLREGIFWGCVVALSSTAIALQALSERRETEAPHGRLVIGALLFQDLCVVPMVVVLPMLAAEGGSGRDVLWALARAVVGVALVVGAARVAVPPLLRAVVGLRNREIFLLAVIGVAMLVAVGTAHAGLSLAMGGFLAGLALSESEWAEQAMSEVAPLRDALASIFFVSIGMLLDPRSVLASPARVLGLFALVLLGKTLIAAASALLLRFPLPVALRAGLGLASVGEFAFLLMEEGMRLGLAPRAVSRDMLAVAVLTMCAAPACFAAGPMLARVGRAMPLGWRATADDADAALCDHVIVAGFGGAGASLVAALAARGVPHVALDNNPDTVLRARGTGAPVRFGDAASPEVLAHVGHADRARLLVLVVSDGEASRRAATLARSRWPDLPVVARVRRLGPEADALAALGVRLVVEEREAARAIVSRVMADAFADGS